MQGQAYGWKQPGGRESNPDLAGGGGAAGGLPAAVQGAARVGTGPSGRYAAREQPEDI